MDIVQQLRKSTEAALASGKTRYAIAKGAGIDYAALVKWLDDGTDIRLSTASKLATYLGLELRQTPAKFVNWSEAKPKKKPKGKQ